MPSILYSPLRCFVVSSRFFISLHIPPYLNPFIFLIVSSIGVTLAAACPQALHYLLFYPYLSLSSLLLNTAPARCISPPIPVFPCVCFEKLLWIIDWQKEEIDAVCLHSEPSHFLHGSLCHSLSVRVPQDHALSPAIATVAPEYHGSYLKLKNALMNTRSHTATGKVLYCLSPRWLSVH